MNYIKRQNCVAVIELNTEEDSLIISKLDKRRYKARLLSENILKRILRAVID
jgi:hypothetical protein